MNLILSLVTCLLAILPVAGADNSTLSNAIASLPPCALTCLLTGLSNSSCSATDIACQCTDTKLNNQVESCVLGSCTIRESLVTKNISSTICGIEPRDHSRVIGILGTTGGTFAVTAVILRCVSRFKSLGGGFWWDDWTIIFAAVLIVPFSALSWIAGIGRLGKDIWAIPLDDIIVFFHQFYFAEVLYVAVMLVTKTSILFFYLRIFPGTILRRITWFLIVASLLAAMTFVCVNAFQCTPIDHYWRQWDGVPGKCFSPSGPAWSISAVGIIIDFAMLSLPLHQVRHLNLHWRKKLSVGLMFGVGFFVTIVSLLRLHSLVHFRNTTNPTYDYYSIGYWTIIEINIGIICACMPSIRVLITYFFPQLFGRSHDHSTGLTIGPPVAGARITQNLAGGVQHITTYSVEYNSKVNGNGSKFVQLVNMGGRASSRSDFSTEESLGREETEGWRV